MTTKSVKFHPNLKAELVIDSKRAELPQLTITVLSMHSEFPAASC
jgi:hypothetical protein